MLRWEVKTLTNGVVINKIPTIRVKVKLCNILINKVDNKSMINITETMIKVIDTSMKKDILPNKIDLMVLMLLQPIMKK